MDTSLLRQELKLPCGKTLKNRIAKSAMSENMAAKDHRPSAALIRLYERWSTGGAAVLFTGNVMIDRRAIGEPHNVVIEDERHLEDLKKWAGAGKQGGSQMWMQINHPGRQAPGTFNKEVVGPSAVQLKGKMIFKTPRPLTETEIEDLIKRYGNTAAIAQKAGFDGVQIHGAHGYLVSQFLSPHTNLRTDPWGGSLENRARFVLGIYREMRARTGPDFPIGIKINSADFQRGGFSEEESMEVIDLLGAEGMDLIEISGGTYEVSAMMGSGKKQSTVEREAYFMDYIVKARKRIATPLMLTGGFRSTAAMCSALENKELDVIGLARPFALYPDLANQLLDGSIGRVEVPEVRTKVRMIDKLGFLDVIWHSVQLERMAQGKDPDPGLSAWAAVWKMGKDAV
jgi:2,4-dienoyl-CoA reductase-like NADH-dependent reductase (Old Yellow Enzyme family)